jgi:hypothetical protein
MTVEKGSEFEPTLGNCNYVVAHTVVEEEIIADVIAAL